MKKTLPHGSWTSTITENMVTGKSPKLSETYSTGERVFWLETLAHEKGRTAVMMHHNGENTCILPRPLSVKSKAHEYGGGAYTFHENTLFFVLGDDQRIYQINLLDNIVNPVAITPASNCRYADLAFDPRHTRLIAVCEEHTNGTPYPHNYLVEIRIRENQPAEITPLHQGHDFYSNPKLSPDGKYICWLTWNNPNMPWDATHLWKAEVGENGQLASPTIVAGQGLKQSIFQPQWSPNGDLYYVSDKTDWWNLYRINRENLNTTPITPTAICPMEAEFATPQWVFGMSTYGFLNNNTLLAAYTQNGGWQIAQIDMLTGKRHPIQMDACDIHSISATQGKAAFIGSSPYSNAAVYEFSTHATSPKALTNPEIELNIGNISIPQPFQFPTTKAQKAYGFYYPPQNTDYCGTDKPPLITLSHGGPTGATNSALNLKIQYWTNRGFAVIDVNYRGSTGYGRDYRESLYPNWGIYDVDDVCAAAQYAVSQNWCCAERLIIKGSSAGGYTTLAALAFKDTFSAGVSLYGIGDLELLANDTHKFEARYLDNLIGPYPKEKQRYLDRSPIHSIHTVECPILVFQGLEDKVVPPNQAASFANAVEKKGIAVAHVTYENEGHGFRNSETITHMLNAELEFYCAIFAIPRHTQNSYITLKNFPTDNKDMDAEQ